MCNYNGYHFITRIQGKKPACSLKPDKEMAKKTILMKKTSCESSKNDENGKCSSIDINGTKHHHCSIISLKLFQNHNATEAEDNGTEGRVYESFLDMCTVTTL